MVLCTNATISTGEVRGWVLGKVVVLSLAQAFCSVTCTYAREGSVPGQVTLFCWRGIKLSIARFVASLVSGAGEGHRAVSAQQPWCGINELHERSALVQSWKVLWAQSQYGLGDICKTPGYRCKASWPL